MKKEIKVEVTLTEGYKERFAKAVIKAAERHVKK